MKHMANIATRASAGALASISALKTGLANVQSTLVKKGGDPFLKLGRDGKWTYGADNVEVEKGSAWAINPLSLMHGWVAWERGDNADNSGGPENEIMVMATQPKPPEHELPKLAKPNSQWAQQYSFSLLCVSGEDKGEQTLFKTNSVGGIAVVDKLLKEIGLQLEADPTKPVPIVVLDSDSYIHKRYGKTYAPIMEVRDWVALSDDLPDVQADLDGEGEPDEPKAAEPAKATRTRKPAEPAPVAAEPDEDDEIAKMEAMIAAKKAAKAGTTAAPVETEAERRKRELREQLAALDAEDTDTPEPAAAVPAAGQPIRRRRA